MKIRIKKVRELIVDVDLDSYLPEVRNMSRIIQIEKENAEELPEYMDHPETTEIITVDFIGECKSI